MYASGSPIALLFIPDTAGSGTSIEGAAMLLMGETDGFAADFTYPNDDKRVAVKAGGLLMSSTSTSGEVIK